MKWFFTWSYLTTSLSALLCSLLGIDYSVTLWCLYAIISFSCIAWFINETIRGNISAILYAIFFTVFMFVVTFQQFYSLAITGDFFQILGFAKFTNEAYLNTVSILSIFFGLIVAGYQKNNFTLLDSDNIKVTRKTIQQIIILSALCMIPFLYGGDLVKILMMSRNYGGGNSVLASTQSSILTALTPLLPLVGVISIFFIQSKTKNVQIIYKIILYVSLAISFVLLLSSGTRSTIGFLFIPPVLFYLKQNKITAKFFVRLVVSIITIITLFNFMVIYRQYGIEGISNESQYDAVTGTELASELFLIFDHYEEPIACDLAMECFTKPVYKTIEQFITHPIPRSYFKEKYIDPSYLDYNYFRTGDLGLDYGSSTNITPTIIGRFYILYGLYGVLWVCIAFSFLLRQLAYQYSKTNNHFNLIFISIFYFYLILLIRDVILHYFLTIVYGYVLYRLNSFRFENG